MVQISMTVCRFGTGHQNMTMVHKKMMVDAGHNLTSMLRRIFWILHLKKSSEAVHNSYIWFSERLGQKFSSPLEDGDLQFGELILLMA